MALLRIQTEQNNISIVTEPGETAADALLRAGYPVPYVCGGRGKCGKCMVLADGVWRQSCQMYPKEDVTITAFGWEESGMAQAGASPTTAEKPEEQMQIVGGSPRGKDEEMAVPENGSAILAVDLGTTTIAAVLAETDTGNVLDSVCCINSQRRYGADVLTRMREAAAGAGDALRILAETDIRNLYEQMREKWGPERINHIYVAGNTAMEHLLLGESCERLSRAPFTPVSLCQRSTRLEGIPLTVLPGASAFVGADIAAGLLACGFDRIHRPVLFLDLGTNGEMALGTADGILATSAPAGPAFEGGNISCGMASVPGAVCKVRLIRERSIVKTIEDKPAAGLCGTGVLELVSELLDNGLVDGSGRLREPYAQKGYPISARTTGSELFFTQQDIRELQMAKAAIRSGVELLLKRAQIDASEIETVYLAGGFGYYLDVRKAVRIGLLPEELERCTDAVGNTSLKGCVSYGCDSSARERMARILSAVQVMNLAEQPEFEETYIAQMSFRERGGRR